MAGIYLLVHLLLCFVMGILGGFVELYYLDLKLDSDVPVTVAVVKEGEETVYQAQGEHWSEDNVRLAIRKPGYYNLMVRSEETYETDAEIKLTYTIY